MGFSELEIANIKDTINKFLIKRRPPLQVRDQVDLSYKIVKNSIQILEIRPQWDNPKIINETPIAKTTFNTSENCWEVFWMRSDSRWLRYDPNPKVKSLDSFLSIVDKDEYCCFWG